MIKNQGRRVEVNVRMRDEVALKTKLTTRRKSTEKQFFIFFCAFVEILVHF